MKVKLRNPERVEDVDGPATVQQLLERLEVNPETVLVIHDGSLVTKDQLLPADAEVEIRPVISGGAGPFLARQSPYLPASGGGMARRVKPLYRLGEREMAAYCVIKGLDYVVEECPLVGGNSVLRYKDALNELERVSPGTKAHFLFGFLDRVRDPHFATAREDGGRLVPCARCDMPTGWHGKGEPICAFCRAQARLLTLLDREGREPVGSG